MIPVQQYRVPVPRDGHHGTGEQTHWRKSCALYPPVHSCFVATGGMRWCEGVRRRVEDVRMRVEDVRMREECEGGKCEEEGGV